MEVLIRTLLVLMLLTGCSSVATSTPEPTATKIPTESPTLVPTATTTPTFTPEPLPTMTPTAMVRGDVYVPWAVDCYDGRPQTGFMDRGFCVPGQLSEASWYKDTRRVVVGNLSSYAPGVMEGTARVREMSLKGYLGGMSSISCGDMGKSAWIALPPNYGEWIGPFLVVDCSQRNHMFITALVHNIVGELSYKEAKEILDGKLVMQGVAIRYGGVSYGNQDTWISYSTWFMYSLEFVWRP